MADKNDKKPEERKGQTERDKEDAERGENPNPVVPIPEVKQRFQLGHNLRNSEMGRKDKGQKSLLHSSAKRPSLRM